MIPSGFDQTNGRVDGLEGDDDGGITPPQPEPTVSGLVQKLIGPNPAARGSSTVDKDPSVTSYSEEG